jgi:hypothetical protein
MIDSSAGSNLLTPRIVGGANAELNEFPWQVSPFRTKKLSKFNLEKMVMHSREGDQDKGNIH